MGWPHENPGPRREPGPSGTPTEAFSSRPAADQEVEWGCSGAQGLQSTSPEKAGIPLAIILQGALGCFLAEAMGKAAGAGVLGMVCPCTNITSSPTDGPEPGGGYCLVAGPELCPIQALFLAPRGRGKESKERSSCSQWNLCLERIAGPAGPEKAITVGSKDPTLKRSWQGAVVQ